MEFSCTNRSKGQLYGDQVHGTLDLVHHASTKPLERFVQENSIVPLLTDWANCLHGRGLNPIPGEEGFAAVRICDACRQSSLEDRWVEL